MLESCSPRHPFRSLLELKAGYERLNLDPSSFFRSVEADLLNGGINSCGQTGRSFLNLDYVTGSVHLSPGVMSRFPDYLEAEFSRIMMALKLNRNIDIIGHPFISDFRYQKAGIIPKWDYS